MQFSTVALVALMLCSAAMASYDQSHCGCTVVGGSLLGSLGGLLNSLIGTVLVLLIDVSTFFVQDGRLWCRSRYTMQGLLGGDQSGYNSQLVKAIDCHRDAQNRCQFLDVELEGLYIDILGIKLKLEAEIIVTVSAASQYVCGEPLCTLLGSSGGVVANCPATSYPDLAKMLCTAL